MKTSFIIIAHILLFSTSCTKESKSKNYNTSRADSVLALMTLEEKIGQMAQLSAHEEITGNLDSSISYITEVINGRVGSLLNVNGAENTRKMQQLAVENSRLGIPLIFGYDVIHGYKTIFPVPLGESASWDLEAIESSARIAAIEASAAGQHWTFAPMVDISRDARWGRIMEGAGEDTWYGQQVVKARIKGFQGEELDEINTIAACAKHYAGYGYSEGGRDYNYTEISDRTLHEVILPPFMTAVEANVATFMTAFNDINGIPASGNKKLGDILRKDWNFNGMVVSDWNSIGEMLIHGIAKDKKEAAVLALEAAIDMDMEGHVYIQVLKTLVEDGVVPESQINNAVRRILKLKFDLGLFDDPYRYCNTEREKELTLNKENREVSRDVARKSIVLLKNEKELLPISGDIKSIALIGPLANNTDDILGNWRAKGNVEDGVSVLTGFNTRFSNTKISYAKGCDINSDDKTGFKKAIDLANNSDIIFMAIGEGGQMSGEGHSRTNLGLPGVQLELLKKIKETGKPIVILLMNGRPMAIPEVLELGDAILETWFLGTEAGNAIADVVSGDYNPSGKLTVTFPNTSGQVPIYYNHRNTGRPGTPVHYTSRYDDAPIDPLLPFGYGLSYTKFQYSNLQLNKNEFESNDEINISVKIENVGKYDGHEVVQLYIQDINASITRPVKELKGFEKVLIKKGESKIVKFTISSKDLAFWNRKMDFTAEPGLFNVMVGSNSIDLLKTEFSLTKKN